MQAQVKWVDGMRFVGRSASGHSITMDTSEQYGGSGSAPSPMEMVLMSVGGCSSIDVVSMLKKARQDVIDCEVELSSERADAVPAIFTKIHLHFVVTGRDLSEAQVKRAVELSADKYCSVSIMLGNGGVEVTHSHEVKSI
ncbi:OsmC family protein [Sansalvadorimonas sp. 2012CJ34-2]|uniref:OsmC family protein n=1 Tax=Parendozoicomonas callyspongiae TaxID=2942213 RepID=A0ABT0PGY8_9GAMM|nr:OsmC family protein [Sansalvadorimonas sp. 2012CJ34-2]MCL6270511.1 OsmC family protein [Sansalvadorimonas sp. 2012CJ34-2]